MSALADPRSFLVDTPARTHRHGWWWKALLSGLALWIATIAVTVLTQNVNLVPTLILLGSFLVPFSVVLFAAERISGSFTGTQLMVAFFVAGVLGVLGASLLETNLTPSIGLYVAVGFIEELVKGVLLVVVGRRLIPKTAGQGALLGAVVGAGFAAFESAGYAFTATITQNGLSLSGLVQTEVLRAVLTPVGHVLWTAVLGAAIFAASRDGRRYRYTWGVILAYVGVSLLHAFWDSMNGLSSIAALLLTGNVVPVLLYNTLRPGTAAEVSILSLVLYVVGLALITVAGIFALIGLVRYHRRRDVAVYEQHTAEAANAR